MKQIFDKIPSFFKNFYVLTAIVFIVWMVFFDSNDFISQVRLSAQQSELEEAKTFYEEKIEEVKALERVVIEVKVNQENAKEDIKEIKDSISKILEKLDER